MIPSLSPVHGGPTTAMATIESALRSQGVDVETCATDDDGPGRRNGKQLGVPLVENGVPRRYFAKWTDAYKTSPPLGRWLSAHVADYDLVHIHAVFSYSSTAAAHHAHARGVPYVVRPLGTLAEYGLRHRRSLAKRVSIMAVERRMLARASAVHFTSETEAAEAESLGLAFSPAVIPLAVEAQAPVAADFVLSRFPEWRDAQRVLFLSRLDPKKNIESLLEALGACAQACPKAVLLVAGAGDPSYRAGLEAIARTLGIAGRVVWAGNIEGDLKASAFARADVFVLPSHSENFGIAAAEALAAGVPCVLSEGVALSAAAAAAGAALRVAPTAAALSDALQALLPDHARRQAMRSRALAYAQEHLSVERLGRELVALYSRILERRC